MSLPFCNIVLHLLFLLKSCQCQVARYCDDYKQCDGSICEYIICTSIIKSINYISNYITSFIPNNWSFTMPQLNANTTYCTSSTLPTRIATTWLWFCTIQWIKILLLNCKGVILDANRSDTLFQLLHVAWFRHAEMSWEVNVAQDSNFTLITLRNFNNNQLQK